MIEVEVKVRCNPDIHDRIMSLGAKPLGVEDHRDIYFDTSSGDLWDGDEALRIRLKGAGAYLTHKGPRLDEETKTRAETTVAIDDPCAMQEILEALDIHPAGEVRKRRTKYAWGGLIFAVDEVEELGTFLEVEAEGGDAWEDDRSRIFQTLSALGLDGSIRESYLELLSREP